jgi:hypothetical protein
VLLLMATCSICGRGQCHLNWGGLQHMVPLGGGDEGVYAVTGANQSCCMLAMRASAHGHLQQLWVAPVALDWGWAVAHGALFLCVGGCMLSLKPPRAAACLGDQCFCSWPPAAAVDGSSVI